MAKVVSVVGDAPGQRCGMGDFAGVLNAELERRGFETATVLIPNLGLGDFPRIRKELEALKPDVIHLQFPSISLGKNPIISLLPWCYRKAPWIISVCEYSVFHPLRQLSLIPLFLTYDHYIFTTQDEIDYCARRTIGLRNRSSIVPAVSNIEVFATSEERLPESERRRRVLYFGQFVPKRGLEDFSELARAAKSKKSDLQFVVVGSTPEWAREFWQQKIEELRSLGCEVVTNASEHDVSRLLASAAFAYFPYPDGASLKRGTLPAALHHDLVVVTNWSDKTEDDVRKATVRSGSPQEALEAIENLRNNPAAISNKLDEVAAFKTNYSLPAVVDRYIKRYEQLVPGKFLNRSGTASR